MIHLKVYNAYCATQEFVVNGIPADSSDFGESFDEDWKNAEEYGCGNHVWRGRPATSEVLAKYNITPAQYAEVVNRLEEGLSFGQCGLCA